ncbi:MAG TPA: tetratricopeptide repeat protein [Verrucomicrobiae bacterium]|nr:tetratricopeptide repeat protein [Verrucomicrobiae bacterium]
MKSGTPDSENPAGSIWDKFNFFKTIGRLPGPVLLGGLFIICATLAAYWPVFPAGFIWDDDAYVTNNALLTAADGWWRIWFSAHFQSQYFPLVYSTLRLEHALWGFNPAGYHVVNVCLHIVNALLVWTLLKRLAVPGAWLAAAIFALHPVQVETVAWVTELKNTESAFFYLLAVLAWLRFCGGKSRWFYGLALLLHALALFAKTTACTLPAVLLLVLWLKDEPVNRRRLLQVTPFLVMGFAMGSLSIWWENHLNDYLPKYHLTGSLLDRLLVATRALWFYAGKIFWPVDLTFSYPRWAINAHNPWQYLWLAGCVLVAASLRVWHRKWGRGPVAALFFFVAVLSPLLGFIPLYTFYFTFVADHYQYLACLGLIALFAAGARRWAARWNLGQAQSLLLALALLLILGGLTHSQCGSYQNLETLWTDTLKKNPRSWIAHTNLGRISAQRDEFTAAEAHYQAALEINPAEEDIHFNYGNLLARMGRLDEAVAQYQEGLQLNPRKPDTHNNLGSVLLKQQRTEEAIAQFRLAIQGAPDRAHFHYNLGSALATEKKFEEAVGEFRQALKLDPASELYRRKLRGLGVTDN